MLDTWRSKVFLPSHLVKPQQALIYKKKNHHLLTGEEPVTVSVGSEIHTLVPLDHLRDEPNTKKSFQQILALMQAPADWQNIVGFLEGLRIARRTVSLAMMQKLVRKANEMGRQGTVMEILRGVERTGVVLRDVDLVREIMIGAVMRAQKAGWDNEAVIEKALKYAEGVVELCEDPRHTEGRRITAEDPRARPEVLGIAVLLASVKAVRFHESRDEDGKVKRDAERMMRLWGNRGLRINGDDLHSANHLLVTWSPVWHGMRMALECMGEGSDLASQLQDAMTQDLEPFLQKAKDILTAKKPDAKQPRGLNMYESLATELSS